MLSGDASWSTHLRPNGCAILPDGLTGRTLRCERPFDNPYWGPPIDSDDRVFFQPLYIDTPADAALRVDVAYGADEPDRTPSDDRAGVDILHVDDPAARFVLDAPIAMLTHPDEPSTLRLLLTQPVDAFPRDATLTAEIPDTIVVTSAQVTRREPGRPADAPLDCTVADAVICLAPTIEPGIGYTVELRIVGTGPGADPIGSRVATDHAGVPDPIVTHDVHVEHLRSMNVVQTLLDDAADGDTIVLPPGVYGGTLNGRGKTLDVGGAEGDERTVPIADADTPPLVGAGPRSTGSGLVLRSFGAPLLSGHGANFTFAESLVEPARPGRFTICGTG